MLKTQTTWQTRIKMRQYSAKLSVGALLFFLLTSGCATPKWQQACQASLSIDNHGVVQVTATGDNVHQAKAFAFRHLSEYLNVTISSEKFTQIEMDSEQVSIHESSQQLITSRTSLNSVPFKATQCSANRYAVTLEYDPTVAALK